MESSELMDVQTAAEWLQVSPRTVLRRTAAGELPGFRRIGRASRWSRTVLHLWVLRGCPADADSFELQLQQCHQLPPVAIREAGLAAVFVCAENARRGFAESD